MLTSMQLLVSEHAVGPNEEKAILLMRYMWDACCIGVPPTPYDAVEVRLSEPHEVKRGHTFSYGTVQGLLKVDPYLVNNWLVGLYLMEEASLKLGGL